VLPVLDFSTIKNELFPVIASVFTKTSSLGIKVRGLEAFVILCGGKNDPAANNDGLDGIMNSNASKKSSSTALDKYTMQEKIVPLIRAIKTKEPAVAIAALNVLRQVGGVADADFVAMDILPVLWSMSLGPLLDLKQFLSFMDLIKSLSSRVEVEQTKKLQELSGTNGSGAAQNDDFMSFGGTNAFGSTNGGTESGEIDFERLVKGNAGVSESTNPMDAGWDAAPASATSQPPRNSQPKPAAFSWSTPSPTTPSFHTSNNSMGALKPQQANAVSRTITPDLSRIEALSPTTTQFSQPLQPQNNFSAPLQPQTSTYNPRPLQPPSTSSFQSPPAASVNWGAAAAPVSNPWASSNTSSQSLSSLGNSMSSLSMNQQQQQQRPAMNTTNSFSLPPPPGGSSFSMQPQQQQSTFVAPPAFGQTNNAFGAPQQQNAFGGVGMGNVQPQQQKKSGLDAWESLL
jgi:SCY1-like protein 2